METARILRTDPQTEQSLVFVEHIRLRCQICGVIVQPTELERTLWADDICPQCSQLNTFKHKTLSADFNKFLNNHGDKIRNNIRRLERELTIAQNDWNLLIDEAGEFCDKFKWIDQAYLKDMRDFSGLDFNREDDFDFSDLKF